MSRGRNPFDSDDESGSPVKSSSKAAINPFDDDANFKPQARVSRPRNPNHHRAKNPFDDDDDALLKTQSRSSQQKGFFDDGSTPADALQHPEGHERSRNQFKARVSASGDVALKKAQKIKDAGSSQASKLVDGGITQVHKIKESTQSAFKAQSNPRKSSNDMRNGHGNPQLRDELFEGVSVAKPTRVHYDDSQFQQQELEYRSVGELEGYALQKSEETTTRVENCLRVAEEIKGDATRTLLSLHEQGEQIRKTHEIAFDIDNNLSRGEKLLGSLGGMFSRTWKPKKGRPISGPAISKNDSFKRRGHHLEQRVTLGLNRSNSKGRAKHALAVKKELTTQDKLELEKAKQDDTLSALSDVLDDLKIMSQDMAEEVARHNPALDVLHTDVSTLNDRVEGANERARRLLRR